MEFQSKGSLLTLVALLLTLSACGSDRGADAAEADEPAPRQGAVSAATAEATDAGIAILAAGGNAVDAAVAVSFALGVTEPGESGLGGAVTMLIAPPDRPAVVIDGTPTVPAAASDDGDPTGYALVAIPTAVRVLEVAWREYGSGVIAWEELLAPAIRLAEEGYPLGRFRHRSLVREYERLRADSAAASLFLGRGGTIPTEQTTLPNPALARTLRRLAEEGPAEFYRGRIAQTLVEEAGSGGLTRRDLAELRSPPVVEPLEGRYRDWEVLTLPSPHRGADLLQGLRLLERAPSDLPATPGVARTQWIVEALRFALLPARTDTAAAPGSGLPGDPDAYLTGRPPMLDPGAPGTAPEGGGRRTTHFSVADERGLAVAVGQSLGGPFGAGILSPGLGFFLNRFVAPSGADGARAAAGEPTEGVDALGAVLRHEEGDLVALGSPGGWRGTEALVQTVSAVVDGDLSLREAVALRRVHWIPGTGGAGTLFLEGASWSAAVPELGLGPPGVRDAARPPSPLPDSVRSDTAAEARSSATTTSLDPRAAGAALRREAHSFFGDSVAPVLRARGFRLGELATGLTFEGRDPYFGRVQAVGLIVGAWEAAADPRSDGEGRVFSPDDLAGSRPPGVSR